MTSPIDNSQPQSLPDFKSEHSPDTSPSKPLKTLIPDSPSSKGKSKIEDDEQQQLGTCGVCLLGEGMSLRGFIDSCDHYFCFVCIMEWAKVESRCPICKRRFSTIRRPSKHGVFLSDRIVHVPVRDQIYYYYGNATIGPTASYSQVKCSVCSNSSDEHLLLLCDLCDSAAHSFCVGLGATVPEGDWFCKDCTLSKDEHAKVETDTTTLDDNNHNAPSCSNTVPFAQSDASIHDIVTESSTREPASVDPYDTHKAWKMMAMATKALGKKSANKNYVPKESESRKRKERLLNDASNMRLNSTHFMGLKKIKTELSSSKNFTASAQVKTNRYSSQIPSTTSNVVGSSEQSSSMAADKNCAKRVIDTNYVPKESESLKRKERLLNDASTAIPISTHFMGFKKIKTELPSSKKITASPQLKTNHYSSQNPSTTSNVVGSSEQSSSMAAEKNCAKRVIDKNFVPKESESRKRKEKLLNDASKASQNSTHFMGLKKIKTELSSCKMITASAQVKTNHYSSQNPSTMSNVVGSSDQSSSMAAEKNCAKRVIDATFKKNENVKKDSQLENAKSEIQSLVKLNLKLVSRDNKLEVDVFKEVARHATHSIMAACGIEPPKAQFRSFGKVNCDHGQTRNRPTSTLMPTSCRECFFTFIKDVVTSIASDRTNSCKP